MYLNDEVEIYEIDLETHFANKGIISSERLIEKAKSFASKATGRNF